MNKLSKITSLLVLAVGSFGVYSGAQDAPDVATNHVLKGTYINNGNYNANIPAATYTPIDTQLTVVCPGTGTCTIEADMWVDFGGATSFDAAAICLVVDGVQTFGCPFEALLVPQDRLIISLSQPLSGLAPGNHTVQTFAYASSGAFIEFYTANYRVYKP